MSMQSTDTPSVAVPVASHAKLDVSKLTPKISIKNLEFFYGDSRALKGISWAQGRASAACWVAPGFLPSSSPPGYSNSPWPFPYAGPSTVWTP